MNAAALVLPEFALILLGVLLRRWAWRSPHFRGRARAPGLHVLVPVLLLRTTLAAELAATGAGAVLLTALGATVAGRSSAPWSGGCRASTG